MHEEKQQASFCTTSSTTSDTRKLHKGYHAKFHLWQIKSPVSSSQCCAFIARSISEATTMDLLEG